MAGELSERPGTRDDLVLNKPGPNYVGQHVHHAPMTQVGLTPEESHAATVRAMASGLTAAAALKAACEVTGQTAETAAELDTLTIKGCIPASSATDLTDVLSGAAKDGHGARAEVQTSEASLEVLWVSTGRAILTFEGSLGDLAAQGDVAALERAIKLDDAPAALALLRDADCVVEVVLRAPLDGARWIPSAAELAERLSDGRWGSTLLQLRRGTEDLPAVAVVHDAANFVLRCRGLLLAGPAARLTDIPTGESTAAGSATYRQAPSRVGTRGLFVPGDLVPAPAQAGSLEVLRPLLESCARVCCWYWLASSTNLTSDNVAVGFNGVRPLRLDLIPYGGGADVSDVDEEVRLFTWASAMADPVRDDAVQQAVTFAVRDLSDLPGVAGPVLRTARSLHELASRGAVAEALAARRGARDAAVAASRAAATAAREVGAKSVERTLTLLIAVAVALVANGQKLLGTSAAWVVVVAAAVLALVTLAVADRVELKSGCCLLSAFDEDVELYREALGEDDIQAVRNLSAVSAARADLSRARWVIRSVYLSAAVIVLVAGAVQLHSVHSVTTPAPVIPTTSLPSPSPSAA